MQNKYRIVRSPIMPLAVQIRRWWFPIWVTLEYFHNKEPAREYVRGHMGGVVEYIDIGTGDLK